MRDLREVEEDIKKLNDLIDLHAYQIKRFTTLIRERADILERLYKQRTGAKYDVL